MSSVNDPVLDATHSPGTNDSTSLNGPDDGAFENVPINNTSDKKVALGFHMQVQRTHRKRKRDTGSPPTGKSSMSLSSSSSSSSDEEETKPETSATSSGASHPQHTDEKVVQHSRAPTRQKEIEPKEKNPEESEGDSAKAGSKGTHHLHHSSHQQSQQQQNGWRVKLYRLNADGSWDDCGTGRILCLYKQQPKTLDGSGPNSAASNLTGDAWIYQELGEPTLCMHSEVNTTTGASTPRILLRTRILLRDAYQRQGDNIITWCEPYLEEGNPAQGVDLALSFQDNAGCLDIWRQITQVQSKAADLFRRNGGDRAGANNLNDNPQFSNNNNNDSRSGENSADANGGAMSDVAHAVAAAHHADLQRQEQQEMWVNVASEAAQHHLDRQNSLVERNHNHHFEDAVGMVSAYHESASTTQASQNNPQSPQLPNPPTLGNLEEIADTIAAVQVSYQWKRDFQFAELNVSKFKSTE